MGSYYVLWRNKARLPVWSGPYDTLDEAQRSTAMRDRHSGAFIVQALRF